MAATDYRGETRSSYRDDYTRDSLAAKIMVFFGSCLQLYTLLSAFCLQADNDGIIELL